ncbi:helix-turn-helix domain-containing protein [uncultured Gimesia sp.]|uniref:helix-turn-helix domain-containing protein n=1 Tax=uncultured Gimesia sp. TaxID=1678688 RepID=UPI00260F9D86|nr:helix-turn-helix domain-containing protein [uncultured Gimesia sp.]
MTTKQRKPLFERLKQGLEEGIAHAKGELTLKTVKIPDDPPKIDAATLAALRSRAAMSQAVFAKMLSVSTKTLQSWEQGTRQPSGSSLRIIQMFSEHPEVVCESVGLPIITLKGVKIKEKKIVVTRKPPKKSR